MFFNEVMAGELKHWGYESPTTATLSPFEEVDD